MLWSSLLVVPCLAGAPRLVALGAPRSARDLVVQLPEVVLRGGGTVSPVGFEGDPAPVGFVWTGDLTAELRFADPSDGQALANRLVRLDDQPADALVELGRGGLWRTPADSVLVVAPSERIEAWIGSLPSSGTAGAGALDRHLRRLHNHLDPVPDVRLPIRGRVAADQALIERGMDPDHAAVFVDLHGTRRLRTVVPKAGTVDEDGWLTVIHDPFAIDSAGATCGAAWSLGDDARAGFTGGLVGRWPCRAGEPVEPLVPVSAQVRIEATPRGVDQVDLAVEARLEVRAGDQPVIAVPVDVWGLVAPDDDPHGETRLGEVHLADGAAVETTGVYAGSRTWLVLPEPLAPGASTTLIVPVQARWSLTDPVVGGNQGKGTLPIYPVPDLGSVTSRWPTTLEVVGGGDLEVAMSGLESAQGDRRTATLGPSRLPAIAFGQWVVREEEAVDGHPPVKISLFPSEKDSLAQFPPLLRMQLGYYEQLLPGAPLQQLELFQSADSLFGWQGEAPAGLVSLQQARTLSIWAGAMNDGLPNLSEMIVAHEVAHQWFGHVLSPAGAESRWISESFAQMYADLFARAAWGVPAGDKWRAHHREQCELGDDDGGRVALTRAIDWEGHVAVYHCGPTVLHALRARIGDQAFFSAVADLATRAGGRPLTSEEVVQAFSSATGSDQSPFLDWWLDVGLQPAATLSVQVSGGRVEGVVTTDLPFGRLSLPVRVWDGKQATDLWVDVVDGQGRFSAAGTRAELDPDKIMPLRSRKLTR